MCVCFWYVFIPLLKNSNLLIQSHKYAEKPIMHIKAFPQIGTHEAITTTN